MNEENEDRVRLRIAHGATGCDGSANVGSATSLGCCFDDCPVGRADAGSRCLGARGLGNPRHSRLGCLRYGVALVALGLLCISCGGKPDVDSPAIGIDPQLASHGTIEVTAELVEIPEGAIFKRDLYDYATILKYRVVRAHRGAVDGETIYVGHYNPWKPRSEAADQRVRTVGGNLGRFEAGQWHRMALEAPIDDHFMGGIVNKYFGQTTNALYWAVWTNEEKP